MRKLGAFVALLLVHSALATGVASAAHDIHRFELESNAFNGGASGYDWNSLFPVDTSSGEIAKVFIADGPNPPSDTSYFTGGGSKDINDVTEWEHTTGDVAPDKNEITNAFAVAYRSPRDTGKTDEGDLMLYFGADRFANNGDAQIGFWFFRDRVGIRSDGTFSGSHSVGDILVLSHFTQGGRVGDVRVYKWVGSGGSDGVLDLIVQGEECGDGPNDDAVCSSVNDGAVPSPWSYDPKFGSAGSFPAGSFYEGGLNASRLIPGISCFSSYLAETRSSQAVDAQLKDLALGDFDTCPPKRARTSGGSTGGGTKRLVAAPKGPELAASGPEDVAILTLIALTFIAAGVVTRQRATEMVRRPAPVGGPRRRNGARAHHPLRGRR